MAGVFLMHSDDGGWIVLIVNGSTKPKVFGQEKLAARRYAFAEGKRQELPIFEELTQ